MQDTIGAKTGTLLLSSARQITVIDAATKRLSWRLTKNYHTACTVKPSFLSLYSTDNAVVYNLIQLRGPENLLFPDVSRTISL